MMIWIVMFIACALLPVAAVLAGRRWPFWTIGLIPMSWVLVAAVTYAMMTATTPDRAYYDTYYIFAHYSYAIRLALALCGPALAFFLLWKFKALRWPKWLAGLNLTAYFALIAVQAPQYFLGLSGMPRRYIDYPDHFLLWNTVSSICAVLMALAMVAFLALTLWSILQRIRLGPTGI